MNKLYDIVCKNRLYVFFLIFIALINLLVLTAERVKDRKEAKEGAVVQVETRKEAEKPKARMLFTEEEIKAKQEKLESLALQDPIFYIFLVLLNLTIFFIILAGFIFNVIFFVRWLKRKPLEIRLITKQSPQWGIGDIVRVTLAFIFWGYVISIIQGMFMGIFPIFREENFRMIFNTSMMNIVGISVILYFVVSKYKQNTLSLGLTKKGIAKSVFYGAIGYITIIPILFAIMLLTAFVVRFIKYEVPVQPIVQLFMEEKGAATLWISALFAAIFGPIAEEIFFRGFMYPALKKKIGMFWAMVASSGVFSFLHAHVIGFLPIMVLGLLLAYLYEKTGTLFSSISVHIMHNLGMLMLVFLTRYLSL